MKTLTIRNGVVLLLLGVTSGVARPAAVVATAKPGYPVVSRLISRHYTIEIAIGPTEPVYTVTGEKGVLLTDHITLAAMKQSNPDLFKHITPAIAMGDVDASIRD